MDLVIEALTVVVVVVVLTETEDMTEMGVSMVDTMHAYHTRTAMLARFLACTPAHGNTK